MNQKLITTGAVALVIGLGLGYFGGHAFAKSPASAAGSRRGGFGMASSTFMGGRGGLLSGTVAAKDASSITIDTRDGSSHVVLITPSTNVLKSVSGTLNDLSIGSAVTVTGSQNSDGSVAANLIQLRPAFQTGNALMIPAQGAGQ